ncbi:hypothetical protein [Pedobacter xixiisoli]|uniref:Lipoprotein n=1 Tax=Pedobacter xixiisoli TaxID=1476464 RepID=A0A286A0P2_9SPHI|nr:hypothetical protein [Pedobacter xixiisoli]SOD15477.1 hypothetical protein SAMN06297358_2471 [Pedobacter xixiisoli]
MKKYLFFLLVLCLFSCTPSVEKDFKKIPTEFDTLENLIKHINPSKKYIYWECVYKEYEKTSKVIISKGDSSSIRNLKYDVPRDGFINKNWTGYYYIAYQDGKKLKYAYDTKSLQTFIGKIDNLANALLIAETQNFSVDLKKKLGSSYKKTSNGFELHLAKFHSCPTQTEAFKISIDTLGNLEPKTLNYFYNVYKDVCAD